MTIEKMTNNFPGSSPPITWHNMEKIYAKTTTTLASNPAKSPKR
ncbi:MULTISPECIES: hypothetical protein [Aeromonas]|jgi:hypothetical protein|nr:MULTISPECIES: hypothetical protein [Aeromonas]